MKNQSIHLAGNRKETEMPQNKSNESKYVVVRTFSAGVHVGVLVSQNGQEVVLADARRIWRWYGANTLHEIALRGLDVNRSKVSEAVSKIILMQVIEIIPATVEAENVLRSAIWNR